MSPIEPIRTTRMRHPAGELLFVAALDMAYQVLPAALIHLIVAKQLVRLDAGQNGVQLPSEDHKVNRSERGNQFGPGPRGKNRVLRFAYDSHENAIPIRQLL
ncbi:MAG: hypothetical protein ACM336_13625 [Acidobacteriota bacterium]